MRNCRKVAAVMNELGLTFETIFLSFEQQEHKSPEVLALNPNGRIPIIIDHQNNDYVLWRVYVSLDNNTFS